MITEFEKGQWSVIQNVITFMKDDQTAMELCKEAGFGKKKILELEKDSCTFMNEVKAFLKHLCHYWSDYVENLQIKKSTISRRSSASRWINTKEKRSSFSRTTTALLG